jgi:hypothetical protein
MNSGWYVRHIEQLQQMWTSIRTEDCSEHLLTIFKHLKDAEPTLQFKLIDLHCSDELRSKFKEGYSLNFFKCLPNGMSESAAEGSCSFKVVEAT